MTKLALALALGAALSTPAIAAPDPEQPRTMTIDYADLDLSAGAGQRQLDRRIGTAAKKVCAIPGVSTREESRQVSRCVRAAMAGAQPMRNTVLAGRSRGPIRVAAAR